MNARGVALAGLSSLALACGGTDGSSLFDPHDAAAPAVDATAPLDASTQPDVTTLDDASIVFEAGGQDATTIVDAGKPYTDPGVLCGGGECDPSTQLCCGSVTSYYPQVTYSFACEATSDLAQCTAGLPVYCDDDHDCPSSQLCCGDLGQQGYSKVSCKATCTGVVWGSQQVHFCDPNAPDCDTNQTCKASTVLSGYFVCQ